MLIRREANAAKDIADCHGGAGILRCREILADYGKAEAGFAYVHDDRLEPGASIGEHRHAGDEELYVILDGRGTMRIDGVEHAVGPGDACLTRAGHSHALVNGPDAPMRLLVVCTKL